MKPGADELLRIVTWNVNGLRAVLRNGFGGWRTRSGADIIGVQETRVLPDQLTAAQRKPRNWHFHLTPAERKGYSGVGLFSRAAPDQFDTALGEARFDVEGRAQFARFGRLLLANIYFPNGNGKARDNSRVPYKLDFYRAVFERLDRHRREGLHVVVMGDFNTAHREIDLARPKDNKKTSGFLPEERAAFDEVVSDGWIDTYRALHPEGREYTWWAQRNDCRRRNIGWRIDYVMCSESVRPHLRRVYHQTRVHGSDHCPVGVELDRVVLEP